ncbi:MAG TPA: hypothetical protein GXZ55_01280 [Natronincola sp.]|nr:hypothetical protein [Natronincola sp.]
MNKRLISKNLVLFILLALVLSGCKIVGSKLDGGKNQTVQEYLASVGTAIESLDANKIADLIAFPIVFDFADDELKARVLNFDENWDRPKLKIEKADFIEYASTILTEIRKNEFELKVEINDPEEGTIKITGGGNSNEATVENAVLYITLEISAESAREVLHSLSDTMITILTNYIENADFDDDDKENLLQELQYERDYLEDYFDEVWEEMLENVLYELGLEEWPGEFELELPLMPLELTKKGKKWKLDVQAMIDHENN